MTGCADFVPPPLTPLGDGHDITPFDSGEPSLDSWLREHAVRTGRRHLSATHVWAKPDGGVVGYVTLAAAIIARNDLPKAVGRGFPDTIPAILIGRLALDKQLHGQGLGGVLLAEALGLAARSAVNVVAAFVVVDALHGKAAEFYLYHGFKRLPDSNRLVLKIATIASA